MPVYYRRCGRCGFLFTEAFDDWTTEEFSEHIYNEEYLLIDFEYRFDRPAANAARLIELFGKQCKTLSLLDYGCGNGVMIDQLRKAGFADCEGYDPISPDFSRKPDRRFNIIASIETLEHVPNPAKFVEDVDTFSDDRSIILFTTLVQPKNFDEIGLNWWYVAPRSGHISLHSKTSLTRLWNDRGFTVMSNGDNFHIAFRTIPDFAKHLIRPAN